MNEPQHDPANKALPVRRPVHFTRYFRIALFLPLAVGLLGLVGLLPTGAAILSFALVYAGIAYVVFALLVLVWSRSQTERTLRITSWFLPVVFLPFSITPSVLLGGPSEQVGDIMRISMVVCGFTLAIGYLYVFIGWGMYVLLEALRRVVRTVLKALQADLCRPGDVAHPRIDILSARFNDAADLGRVAICPGGLGQHGACIAVAATGNGALPACGTGTVFARHQTDKNSGKSYCRGGSAVSPSTGGFAFGPHAVILAV